MKLEKILTLMSFIDSYDLTSNSYALFRVRLVVRGLLLLRLRQLFERSEELLVSIIPHVLVSQTVNEGGWFSRLPLLKQEPHVLKKAWSIRAP